MKKQQYVIGQFKALCLMEGRIVHLQNVELPGTFLCEVFKEGLEAFGGTVGHDKLEAVSVHGGICPEEVGVAEDLLEGAYRFRPLCREPVAHIGEQAEPAFVLTVKIYFWVAALLGGYKFPAVLDKVFLKAATFSGSFFTWDFLAVLTDAPKWRLT